MSKCTDREWEYKRAFSKRLRKLSSEKPIRQAEVAQMLVLPETTVSSWYRGKHLPDLTRAIELADLFGVSLDYLVRGIELSSTGVSSDEYANLQRKYEEMSYQLYQAEAERKETTENCKKLERNNKDLEERLRRSSNLALIIKELREMGATIIFAAK
jgi:transcriptional regulator with XRE-family HTH domain